MSKTHDKPALSDEKRAAIEAIRERSRTERPGPDELIDRGELDELVPQLRTHRGTRLGGPVPADPRGDGLEPDRPVGALRTDPRRHQPAGKRLESQPDSRDPFPLCGSPRGGIESRLGRSHRTRKGRLTMASVFKRTRDKGNRLASWYIAYVDADGVRRTVKGCPDKAATEAMARKLESEADLRRRGIIDAKADQYAAHAARPLSEHVDAWRDTMIHQDDTPKHADMTAGRVRRLIAVIFGAKPNEIDGKRMTRPQQAQAREMIGRLVAKARLSDLATERVQAALATFRESGRSAETCNHHRNAIRAFARWCKRTGRLREYPLEGMTGFNAKEDRRHDRRTLSLDELTRLIAVAERGPDFQAMTGPARALCYRLAASTGLRYSEIASIRPASFDWKALSVRVAASYTKNGQEAELPMPSDLASDLTPFVAALPPDAPVFPLPEKGVKMLRADLQAAAIPYKDASGLVFDFHSLRCQTATLADAAGVSPRVVQRLMRHSTLELTGRYTRPRAVDIEAAAERLPSLKPTGDRPVPLALTGTDPAPSGTADRPDLTALCQRAGDISGRDLSSSDVMTRSSAPACINEKPPVSRGFDASRRDLSSSVEARPVGFEPTTFGFEVRDSIR